MKFFVTLAIAGALVSSYVIPICACTAAYSSTSKRWEIGYNMDWFWLGGMIVTRPAGLKKTSTATGKYKWTAKYRSVGFSNYSADWPWGGVNEHGLQIFALGTPTEMYDSEAARAKLPAVNELEIMTLLLDTAKDVKEAEQVLNSTRVDYFGIPAHYILCDMKDCLIVDFGNGMRVHRPKPGEQILSNDWYDDMIQSKADGVPISSLYDPRGRKLLDWLEKNPTDVDGGLTRVHQGQYTRWYVRIYQDKGKDMELVVTTSPYTRGYEVKNEINLTQLFNSKSFDLEPQWISLGENSYADPKGPGDYGSLEDYFDQEAWQPFTSEDDRKVFLYNLRQTEHFYTEIFSRNKDYRTVSIPKIKKLIKRLDAAAPPKPTS